MTQVLGIKRELKKVIKEGYGSYIVWIGWCNECKKFRVHTQPMYITSPGATCSDGHWSRGLSPRNLLKRLK